MTSYGFLSAAFVVVLLTGVALLAGASAVNAKFVEHPFHSLGSKKAPVRTAKD